MVNSIKDSIFGSSKPRECQADDTFSLCYTSGTTGDSKGVKTTHKGLITTCQVGASVFGVSDRDVIISYLPSPHVFD